MSSAPPSQECCQELDRLRVRLRRLAEEKSTLQLITRLVERLNPMSGVEDLVRGLLHSILETIGGTNIKLYYWIENELHYIDFTGTNQVLSMIDDPLVAEAAERREFIEQSTSIDATLLQGSVAPIARTWVFPLAVGSSLVGVIKLENVHIGGDSLRTLLPVFFSHTALILSNEIRSVTRQKAEAALAASETRFRRLVKTVPIALCYVSSDGHIQDFNDRFAQTFGYSREELPDLEAWWRLAYPDPAYRQWVRATWAEVVVEAAASGNPIRPIEYQVTCKNGDVRTMEISGVILGDNFLATLIDLTEHKKAEQTTRLAASVFANSQEGIIITDAENRILDVNAAFTRICGYDRAEVIGQNPKILASGRHDDAFFAEMWRAIHEKGAWQGEVWNRKKSGEVFVEMLSIDAVSDEAGRIQHYVGAFTDISTLKEHQAELEKIAHYDTLTGIPNRRLLSDRMAQELSRARRSGRPVAVCYLDLDGFKPVNDVYGHKAGDQVLIEVSHRLQQILRTGDTLARIGGDEFVLLFCDLAQEQQCYQGLERVLSAIAQPIPIGADTVSVSASIGVTLFPRDDADADTLLRHADQAMYQAKEAGKGRFHLFDAEHDRLIKANRATVQRLQRALDDREFLLHYQPKVQLTGGGVIGVEALIRWQHPVRGLLSPAEFLPLLMGTELELALGDWVIESALHQIELWKAGGLALGVSVNVSANHLLRPNFVDHLKSALERHPTVAAGDLELEVLESAAIDDLGSASRVLSHCMALGVHFALDDFGTGYSSLAYFRKLPVGTLKIDQGFVRDMLDDPEDIGIIESVIALAKAFNRPVIAEGVETLEHGAMLVLLGCELGQGYGIARPMPPERLPAWVAQWQGEDVWRTISDYGLPKENVVLIVAGTSHRKWADQIAAYVSAPTEQELPALGAQECRFGRWYQGSGISAYGHLAEFQEIGDDHQRIHDLAGDLVALVKEGRQREAEERMEDFFAARDAVSAALNRLVEKVAAEHSSD